MDITSYPCCDCIETILVKGGVRNINTCEALFTFGFCGCHIGSLHRPCGQLNCFPVPVKQLWRLRTIVTYESTTTDQSILALFPGSNGKVKISHLQVSPDPVKLSAGSMKITVAAALSSVASPKLEAQLTIKKKMGFIWVKAPCTDGVGSW